MGVNALARAEGGRYTYDGPVGVILNDGVSRGID